MAVMPLQAKGVTANEADVVTDGVVSHMQQTGTQRVLERAQMDQILREQGFSKSGACDRAECAVELGRLLSVDRILVGSVGLLGRTYTLNLRMVSVSTGEVLRTSLRSRAGTVEEVLTQLVPESISDLVRGDGTDTTSAGGGKAADSKRSNWMWWAAGGTAIVGGTAAVLLLTRSSSPSSSASGPATTILTTSW